MENQNTSSKKGKRNKKKGKGTQPPTLAHNANTSNIDNAQKTDITNSIENSPSSVEAVSGTLKQTSQTNGSSTHHSEMKSKYEPGKKETSVQESTLKSSQINLDNNKQTNSRDTCHTEKDQTQKSCKKDQQKDSAGINIEKKSKKGQSLDSPDKFQKISDKPQDKSISSIDNEVNKGDLTLQENIGQSLQNPPDISQEDIVQESKDKSDQNNRELISNEIKSECEQTDSKDELSKQDECNIQMDATISKSKQDLLLAALEKPLTENKNVNVKEHLAGPEKCVLNAKAQETIKNSEAQLDKKKEKELRKLEWEKRMAEQDAKKDKSKEGLSKAELKAKRREQQEAQRLAKLGTNDQKPEKSSDNSTKNSAEDSSKNSVVDNKPKQPSIEVSPKQGKSTKSKTKASTKAKKIIGKESAVAKYTRHLYCANSKPVFNDKLLNFNIVHPDFVKLSIEMHSKVILGSNARCLAMLRAIIHLVRDLQSPPRQEFCRYLETVLQRSIDHLNNSRPIAVCMDNALKYFESQLSLVDVNSSEKEIRNHLTEVLESYVKDDREKAAEFITMETGAKIKDGDVILTFGVSSLVEKCLLVTQQRGKTFSVIIADSAPLFEGREMMRRLTTNGVKCKYIQMSALRHVMKSVSLICLGSNSLLSNGYIMSRAGMAEIGMIAKTFNKPVVICSELYKLSEYFQIDAFVFNELGNVNEVVGVCQIHKLRHSLKNKVSVVNLLYSFTPPELVTAVITELGSFHPKSLNFVKNMKASKLR